MLSNQAWTGYTSTALDLGSLVGGARVHRISDLAGAAAPASRALGHCSTGWQDGGESAAIGLARFGLRQGGHQPDVLRNHVMRQNAGQAAADRPDHPAGV